MQISIWEGWGSGLSAGCTRDSGSTNVRTSMLMWWDILQARMHKKGAGAHSCHQLRYELPAVAAGCGVYRNASQAPLAMPRCIGDQKLLRMHRVLQRQPRKLHVDPGIQAA